MHQAANGHSGQADTLSPGISRGITVSPAGAAGNNATMSSREIADLCEARHNDVVATIRRLFDQGILRESRNILRAIPPEGRGRPIEVYDLTKRDTLVVASGYNAELRARIIDRWQELEARAADPMQALGNPETLRHLLLGYTEKVTALESKVEELSPKAEALDRLSASDGSVTFTQAAKLIGVKRDALTRWMSTNGWVYRQNGSWVAYHQHIHNGRLEYKEANYTDEKTGARCARPYCHITPKGLAKLAKAFAGGAA